LALKKSLASELALVAQALSPAAFEFFTAVAPIFKHPPRKAAPGRELQ
jgi:hypothetical protein